MPVATFDAPTLRRLAGTDMDTPTLGERLPMLGGDLDKIEGERLTIEWFPDRPDLLPIEGTARALAAFLGNRPGLPNYPVAAAKTTLTVDASVQAIRPHAALCFVRGVPFDDLVVDAIVEAQEKLCVSAGRKRRKIAIGVHDAAGIEGPFTYTTIGPNDSPFVPLKEVREMTPAQIVAEHPKGQEYGHLVPADQFPVFLDGAGQVLSMPPIINAAKTTVTADTRDVLLDVTGTDAATVRQTIALLATCLAERGGTIEAVEIADAQPWTCPDLSPREKVLDVEDVTRLLGLQLDGDAIAEALRRTGHGAEAYDTKVLVQSPPWRFDLLHTVDWIEDVAIGYGYDNFPGSLPTRGTFGSPRPEQAVIDKIRTTLCGLGLSEAMSLSLTNTRDAYDAWGKPQMPHVKVRNAVLEDRTILRTDIVPGLLQTLAQNRHRPLPQRLWELGEVVHQQGDAFANRLHLGIVEVGARTGFAAARALTESIIDNLNLDASLVAADLPGFISGRCGEVHHAGKPVGHFGELHPNTIVAFGLGAATIAISIDVEAFL